MKEPWRSVATGDMTLCLVDANGTRILRIDMLGCGTMRAGNGGDRLARAYNDLALLAYCPLLLKQGQTHTQDLTTLLPHPDAGISPLPWSLSHSERNAKLTDSLGKRIAEIELGKRRYDTLIASLGVVERALPILNHAMSPP